MPFSACEKRQALCENKAYYKSLLRHDDQRLHLKACGLDAHYENGRVPVAWLGVGPASGSYRRGIRTAHLGAPGGLFRFLSPRDALARREAGRIEPGYLDHAGLLAACLPASRPCDNWP